MDYSNNYSNSHTHTEVTTPSTSTPVRGTSPNPDPDQISHASATTRSAPKNPFISPFSTRPSSFRGSSSAIDINQQSLSQRYFHSRRVKKGQVERPWLDKKDPRQKYTTIIPLGGILLGLAIAGFLIYDGLKSVVNHQYCQILDEDWSKGFNTDVWTKEVEVGGFGYVFIVCF
jgi:hypothetical protein